MLGPTLDRYRARFATDVPLDRLITISRDLREEREKAFYGEVDFIPTEEYGAVDGERARDGARLRSQQRSRSSADPGATTMQAGEGAEGDDAPAKARGRSLQTNQTCDVHREGSNPPQLVIAP